MSSLIELRRDHADMVKMIAEWKALVERPTPPPSIELFDVRRRLSSLLIAHLKAEDWVLYPPLRTSKDATVASVAERFEKEMGGLAQAFTAFLEKWDALRITANWGDYQQESRGIAAALTDRITRENRELFPLLERHDRAA